MCCIMNQAELVVLHQEFLCYKDFGMIYLVNIHIMPLSSLVLSANHAYMLYACMSLSVLWL